MLPLAPLKSNVLSTSYSPATKHNNGMTSSYKFTNSDGNFTFEVDLTGEGYTYVETLNAEIRRLLRGDLTGVSRYGEPIAPVASNQLLFSFNSSTDIPASMDLVAMAMTTHMQALSDVTMTGEAGSIETYIHVIWAWIALPGILVASGVVCLALAMIKTKRHGMLVWKASEIALLFHGLDPPIPGASLVDRASEMEDISRRVDVKLAKGDNGQLMLQRKGL